MAGLTPDGLVVKTSTEILNSLNQETKNQLGADFDTSPTSTVGILNNIDTGEFIDLWEALQGVYDSFNRDKAEGKSLDDLAALVGLSRLSSATSTGDVGYQGRNGIVIPAGFSVDSESGLTYLTSTITISSSRCYRFTVTPSIADNTLYRITINGVQHDYASLTGQTPDIIRNFIKDNLNLESDGLYVATVSGNDIIITSVQVNNSLNFSTNENYVTKSITTLGLNSSSATGAIIFNPNTVNKILVPIAGLDSVNNPEGFTLGRDIETDEELRIRMANSSISTGTATVPAILTALRNIAGVSIATILENIEITTVDGLPAKSYECIIQGGSESDIAEELYRTKPAGIELFGNTSVTTVDLDGNPVVVKFSRPTPVKIYANINYSLYSEELFPANGVDLIKQGLVDEGNLQGVGVDIIPTRLIGGVYKAVNGVGNINVTLSTNGIDYSTDVIPIAAGYFGSFSVVDVTAQEV